VLGSGLSRVRRVTFLGSSGRGDDVDAKVRPGSARRLSVRVPLGAVSGPVSAMVSKRLRSRPSRPVSILPPPPPTANPTLTPVPGPREGGAPRLETGTSSTRAFLGAQRPVTFSYRITERAPSNVRVELTRAGDGAVIRTWTPPAVGPGFVQRIVWDGKAGRAAAGPGRYSFRLTVAGESGAVARSSAAKDFTRDAFDLYNHIFPVRGRHDFGGAGARFGAGRAGHSHQGQDVMAACGTRMVAARGGKVQYKGYHSAAGNYLVIDGSGTSVDYVYMHLAEPTPFAAGDRVYTGQRIGSVGETGNARGCHLHFELWKRPGWYDGGRPFNPLPSLRAWDRWS
jgi:murein DD-endopeptidase MepM/ murein hydrolase activator NlpD